jgi:Uma2 family endonuclease
MSEAAVRRMTLEEFLTWDDGTDTRYELVGGFPIAMAPGLEGHRTLSMRLGTRIDAALSNRRPCRAETEAGILHPERADTFFIADLAVTCTPLDSRRQYTPDPILLIEILSTSTERHDRRVKIPAYQRISSVQELVLVDTDARYVELHRRQGDQWIIQILRERAEVLSLASVGIEISMSDLYEGFEFPEDDV